MPQTVIYPVLSSVTQYFPTRPTEKDKNTNTSYRGRLYKYVTAVTSGAETHYITTRQNCGLTPELTGRQSTEQAFELTDESCAIAAPVE